MDVVQTLWSFCNTLRHDGINYGDYIEQLTYLLEQADQAILARALRGELVPHDPDDEPAWELVERIRAGQKSGGEEG